ncbi:N,N-dimethylformamidase beta subunit family domain-containing protein [Maribacter algicola]|uniref:N,N-dimethylformamidase beta subunit family domain-containing protein n=1 Tax=Meishania litoralis TaxID=3434685 RepID=A0ACC7LMH2_9FLAO
MNKIQLENDLTGTLDWQISNPATKREIEGYASKTSIDQGESILLFVNTESDFFSISIYRMGWYNGLGARQIKTIVDLKGTKQPIPLPDPNFGLLECDWKSPYTLETDSEWTSGVYVAKLEENDKGKQSYILFVVRNDKTFHDIVFQLPVTTYQAYNFWGGKSLYNWGSGSNTDWGTVSGEHAKKVSFNRPYACSNNKNAAFGMGAGEFFTNIQPVTTHFFPISSASWDYNMVRWLEKNGYDLGYITNCDTHRNPTALKRTRVLMSHGHDEYWSHEMRVNIEKALGLGVNLAFFSSNTMFWQIRFEPSAITKDHDRTLVCYKDLSDPVSDKFCTVNFRDSPVDNPESKLIGVQHFMDPVDGDIIVSNEAHWIFKGTHLKNGDKIKGLLGYEIDTVTDHSPKNIEILTTSPGKNLLENNYIYIIKQIRQKILRKMNKLTGNSKFVRNIPYILGAVILCSIGYLMDKELGASAIIIFMLFLFLMILLCIIYVHRRVKSQNRSLSTKGSSNMTLYTAENGAKVFSTGSMQWCWGLDDYNVPKLRTSRKHDDAETITRNILSDFLS